MNNDTFAALVTPVGVTFRMGAGLGAPIGLHDDHDIERLYDLFVEQVCLVNAGLDGPLHGGFFEILPWQIPIIDLAAILAPRAAPGIGARVGEV
jgi:hypothetical protein